MSIEALYTLILLVEFCLKWDVVMKFHVWLEGYSIQGSQGEAKYLGECEANSFSDAVKMACQMKEMDLKYLHLDGQPEYWGCRFFDNEDDARKFFG
ncbi:hypothetical protein [Acinetobacter gerneri]|uniref:hypothetical protein n=1 Tax=Acinetobacter gerneri TaxID=202952 RepID=UPI0028A84B57|nr:hypothetical protein [Acinetobacter gerneri]